MENENSIEKVKVRYLCDGEVGGCRKPNCYKNAKNEGMVYEPAPGRPLVCKYTDDIRHAKYFRRGAMRYIEQENKKESGRLEFDINTGGRMLDQISELIEKIRERHPEADIRIRMQ